MVPWPPPCAFVITPLVCSFCFFKSGKPLWNVGTFHRTIGYFGKDTWKPENGPRTITMHLCDHSLFYSFCFCLKSSKTFWKVCTFHHLSHQLFWEGYLEIWKWFPITTQRLCDHSPFFFFFKETRPPPCTFVSSLANHSVQLYQHITSHFSIACISCNFERCPYFITKLPASGVLCGNITAFGMEEDHLMKVVLCLCHAIHIFHISLSNCKLKMTELIIKGMELGRNSK